MNGTPSRQMIGARIVCPFRQLLQSQKRIAPTSYASRHSGDEVTRNAEAFRSTGGDPRRDAQGTIVAPGAGWPARPWIARVRRRRDLSPRRQRPTPTQWRPSSGCGAQPRSCPHDVANDRVMTLGKWAPIRDRNSISARAARPKSRARFASEFCPRPHTPKAKRASCRPVRHR
jgi:hypothetical protein